MTERKKVTRSAASGKYVVRSAGRTTRGGEMWKIASPKGGATRVVKTSAKSAAALDEIISKHAGALKRLADK